MAELTLYSYWRSTSSWRVRIALAHKQIAYRYVPVHLMKEGGEQVGTAHRARNPMAQVPVLEWEEAGAIRRLTQSLAIIYYIETQHPSPALLPADTWQRAQAWEIAEIVNAGIQPVQNLSVTEYVHAQFGGDRAHWNAHWIARGMAALEAAVAQSAGRYCVGDAISIADLCVMPQLYNAQRFAVSLEACPTLRRIEAVCAALPAFQAAHPDLQPDAEQS